MGVSFKHFEKWAKDRFGDDNVLVRPPEIRINSIFEKDDDVGFVFTEIVRITKEFDEKIK